LLEVASDSLKIQVAGMFLCCYDDIAPLGKLRLMVPEKLPYESFDPVSFNRVTRFFPDNNPQPPNAQPIVFDNNRKVFCVVASTQAICIDKTGSI